MDKFQGQQAPIVIYSMAASSPEEAAHGPEFLYNLNRTQRDDIAGAGNSGSGLQPSAAAPGATKS